MSDNGELRVNRVDIPAELPLPVPPVSYREEVRIFMMGQDLASRYEAFERETTERVVQMMEEGDTSGLLPWFTTLLRFPDMPWLNWTCKTRAGVVLGEVQALPEASIPPLERGLLDYVEEQYWKRLPVLVFTENSGPFDDQEHLKALFETHVRNQAGEAPSVAVLRSTVAGTDRATWLEQHLQAGLDVLVCNPVLLEVGVDLRAFARIIYKRTPVTFARLRQSARCSHRPGQTHDVEVVFCMYASSMALRWLYTMLHEQQGPTDVALAALACEVLKSYQQRSRYQMDDFSGVLSRAEP